MFQQLTMTSILGIRKKQREYLTLTQLAIEAKGMSEHIFLNLPFSSVLLCLYRHKKKGAKEQ